MQLVQCILCSKGSAFILRFRELPTHCSNSTWHGCHVCVGQDRLDSGHFLQVCFTGILFAAQLPELRPGQRRKIWDSAHSSMAAALDPWNEVCNEPVEQNEWEWSRCVNGRILLDGCIEPDKLSNATTTSTDSHQQQQNIEGTTHVSFTPQRLGALFITASITADDISWPAAFAGKLYKRSGI